MTDIPYTDLTQAAQFAALEGIARAGQSVTKRYTRHISHIVTNAHDAIREMEKLRQREAYRQAMLVALEMMLDNGLTATEPEALALNALITESLLFTHRITVDPSAIADWKQTVKKELVFK